MVRILRHYRIDGERYISRRNADAARRPSITKTERLRSTNLLQMPRDLMCKLRPRGQGYEGRRPAGSRGIDPSLQPAQQLLGGIANLLRSSDWTTVLRLIEIEFSPARGLNRGRDTPTRVYRPQTAA